MGVDLRVGRRLTRSLRHDSPSPDLTTYAGIRRKIGRRVICF
jgi:hypothetical protein